MKILPEWDIRSAIGEILDQITSVAEVNLFSPSSISPLQKRLQGDRESEEIIAAGLELRSATGLPFWDCANLLCFEQDKNLDGMVTEALFHNGGNSLVWVRPMSWMSKANLANLESSLPNGRILVISSKVKTHSNLERHIPMLDFHCPPSNANTKLVETCVRKLNCGGGWIVNSSKSYHFYGKHLLDSEELRKFMGFASLLAPITDRAWLAHQIIEGACGLRLSKRQSDPFPPRVIGFLDS